LHISSVAYCLTLMMDAVRSSETSANFYWSIRCHISEVMIFMATAVRTPNPTDNSAFNTTADTAYAAAHGCCESVTSNNLESPFVRGSSCQCAPPTGTFGIGRFNSFISMWGALGLSPHVTKWTCK
jgi:hypothetical protein